MDDTSEPLAELLADPDPFFGDRFLAVIATVGRVTFDRAVVAVCGVLSVLAASMPPFDPKPRYPCFAIASRGTLSPCTWVGC